MTEQWKSIEWEDDATSVLLGETTGVVVIRLNRPRQLNAMSRNMYEEIGRALALAAKDDRIRVVVLTGKGRFFSSGIDLRNFHNNASLMMGTRDGDDDNTIQLQRMAEEARDVLHAFVNALIDFPKILIACVNGPAIGIAVSMLGLCDFVYCSQTATFQTPFSHLGLSPEACSSYTFPRMMGRSCANEVLLLGKRMSARDAHRNKLVSEVFKQEELETKVMSIARKLASFSPRGLEKSLNIIKRFDIEHLKETNKAECELLVERLQSKECVMAVKRFAERSRRTNAKL